MKFKLQKLTCILFTVLLAVLPNFAFAQEEVSMADAMFFNGKIYVVVAVLVIIFTGVVVYLISLDRKITRLEKEIKK